MREQMLLPELNIKFDTVLKVFQIEWIVSAVLFLIHMGLYYIHNKAQLFDILARICKIHCNI